jgi:hypothetical protein
MGWVAVILNRRTGEQTINGRRIIDRRAKAPDCARLAAGFGRAAVLVRQWTIYADRP